MARRVLGKTAVSVKMMIYGKEGSRKSNTAIQFATLKNKNGEPLKTLLIDTEFKAIEGYNEAFLESKGVDFGNVCEMRTRNLSTITQLCDCFVKSQPIPMLDENDNIIQGEFELDANGNPFVADVLILDSISVINDLLVEGRNEIVKKRTNIKIQKDGLWGDAKELALENSGLQFLDYAKLKTKALKMVRDLQAITGKHVIYVARAKDAKESKLIGGKMESIDLGYELMDATAFKFLPYEVNLIIHTKNENGITSYAVEKDSTGVKSQGEVIYEFDVKDYEGYINNLNRHELLKTKSYAEDLSRAKTFTEDCEEGDNDQKFRLWKLIVSHLKTNPNLKPIVKQYLDSVNIPVGNLGKPDDIPNEHLVEIKHLLKI